MKSEKITYLTNKALIYNSATNKFLLLKRTNYDKRGISWDLPGGTIEPGEESPDGILREIKEETDLQVNNPTIAEQYSHIFSNNEWIIYALYFCNEYKGEIKLSNEHSEYKWISADELNNYELFVTLDHIKDKIKSFLDKKLNTNK